jgi:hypothetical protein
MTDRRSTRSTGVGYSVDRGETSMKKPTLRVTKWLGDIPVEAHCTHCPDVSFKAKASSPRPNREEYQKSLQTQFDAHCATVHPQTQENISRS